MEASNPTEKPVPQTTRCLRFDPRSDVYACRDTDSEPRFWCEACRPKVKTAQEFLTAFLETSEYGDARTATVALLETLAERAHDAAIDYYSDGATDEEVQGWERLAESLHGALIAVES